MAYRLPFGAVGMRSRYPLATSSSRLLGAWRCSAANFRTDCVSSPMVAATCPSLGAAVPAADEVPGDALEPDFPQPEIAARQQARARPRDKCGFMEAICDCTRTSQFRLNPQLARVAGQHRLTKPVTQPKPLPAQRQKRGALEESVVALVTTAGPRGITVAEVAARLGAKPPRIFDWFKSTDKAVQEIKKVGRARYGWLA